MVATVRLLCGPSGSGKTRQLLERACQHANAAIGSVLWLAPTRRAVDALQRRLTEECSAGFWPVVRTFQSLADEIVHFHDPTAHPLSSAQRRLLAEEIVTDLHARGELPHFSAVVETRGFGEGVFALLAELKRNEIRPVDFIRAAYRRQHSGANLARQYQNSAITHKDRQCARIYARYQRLLVRKHLFDPEGRCCHARDLLRRRALGPFDKVRAVFVDGFAEFTRTQHDMLSAWADVVEELWIALPDEPSETRAELFQKPRSTITRLARLQQQTEYADLAEAGRGAHRPAGLAHIERQLFQPLRAVQKSDDADGVVCFEAPGRVGEARMVARAVKTLLLSGVSADDVLVTARDLVPYADLIREVFSEYGIPVDVEGAESLWHNGAVATLLRALRLPEEGWSFGPVTALLRSSYFRPEWPETEAIPHVAEHAEVLLRLLAEPGGRDVYLRATDLWADRPPLPLEDEHAEESKRQRKHDLAKACRPFLHHFFSAWDSAPLRAPLREHVGWLRHFAHDLGIARVAEEDDRDRAALARFWQELENWVQLSDHIYGGEHLLERTRVYRLLGILAVEAGLARTPRGPGRVRVLSAGLARTLDVPYLFILGLGERSFPRLTAPEPFFNEAERQAFRQAGLNLSGLADVMPEEMLLFYQLVTRARCRLVLGYPAVDERGQSLLPSSFLVALLECFTANSVPTVRRGMLLDRYDQDEPLCPAEHRVRAAALLSRGEQSALLLPAPLAANLRAAAALVRGRFYEREYSAYDGLLRHPGVVAELKQRFGPDKVFSPTALEEYVACPFRFFFDHVLGLEPLEEPREEIESTDRGLVFHRALSRLHGHLHEQGIREPTAAVDALVLERLEQAVQESARYASPAGQVLWQIEGRRLKQRGARYRQDWQSFLQTWASVQLRPLPTYFEKSFGLEAGPGESPTEPLIISADGTEVRIGGRIDRVDVAERDGDLVFWIIDYKTGRSSSYSGAGLKSFERLQLTLYALAVERVLLADRAARPMGLAYWLVADGGPKVVLPDSRRIQAWVADRERWREVRRLLEETVTRIVQQIRVGAFPLKPRSEHCTDTCPFGQACRISQSRSVEKTWSLALPTIP
jgi:ATP-dependent helicase/nuclease subunit B